MSEELESPVEHLREEIHEIAHQASESWLRIAALISAIMAVLAAIGGLQAGHAANEAMLSQIKAADSWNYYQAKGIKATVLESETRLLVAMGKSAPEGTKPDKAEKKPDDSVAKLERYHLEQKNIQTEAQKLDQDSKALMARHEILSVSVTLFQIAIAIVAISVLTRQKPFLLFSGALGIVAIGFLARGLMMVIA